jgi:hypothetical protein
MNEKALAEALPGLDSGPSASSVTAMSGLGGAMAIRSASEVLAIVAVAVAIIGGSELLLRCSRCPNT